jgi:hypothetical protein
MNVLAKECHIIKSVLLKLQNYKNKYIVDAETNFRQVALSIDLNHCAGQSCPISEM